MRIASSGEVLVIGAEVLVDVEAVDVRLSTLHGRRVNGNYHQLGEIPHPLAAGQEHCHQYTAR